MRLVPLHSGQVHTLENVGNMLALGWLPTQEHVDAGSGRGRDLASRLSQCPNTKNAYQYRDGDHAE
jgi:hypothetical protein